MTSTLIRRTWAYVRPPKAFDVSPCACGNPDTQWSEFEKHCWCDRCQKDFIPEHAGVLSGPIPIQLSALMGLNFDRVILSTGQYERFDPDNLTYAAQVPAEGRPR